MRAYQRHGATVQPFSADEDELITALRIEGMGTAEIAKFVAAALGSVRSAATINMQLKSLAAKDDGQ